MKYKMKYKCNRFFLGGEGLDNKRSRISLEKSFHTKVRMKKKGKIHLPKSLILFGPGEFYNYIQNNLFPVGCYKSIIW